MNVGIVGLGRMGKVHFSALLQAGVTRIFGFDQSSEARERFAHDNKISCFPRESLAASVEEYGIQGLIFATTTPGRVDAILEALNLISIEWVVTEKPFASSIQEAQLLVATADSLGKRLAINHQMRFMEQYALVKSLASANQLGPLVSMNVAGFNIGLANNGSHYFEAFRFLAEDELIAVSAFIDPEQRPSHRGASFRDYSGTVSGIGSQGAKFFMDLSGASGAGLLVTYSFRNGKVVIDELGGTHITLARNPKDFHLDTLSYGVHPLVRNAGVFVPTDLVEATRKVIEATIADANYPDHRSATHSLYATIGAVISGESESKAQILSTLASKKTGPNYRRVFSWS